MPSSTDNTSSSLSIESQAPTNAELRKLEHVAETVSLEEAAERLCVGPQNPRVDPEVLILPNSMSRNIITNSAQIICLNAPPGIDTKAIRNRLLTTLDVELVTIDTIITTDFARPASLYRRAWEHLHRTGWQSPVIPARIATEILGRHIEKSILQKGSKRKFIVDGFPNTEMQAAIVEEDIGLIRAYIHVSGEQNPSVPRRDYDSYEHGNEPVREKLKESGRLFTIDAKQDQEEINNDVDNVISILRSIEYQSRVDGVGDVFRRR
ncbi:MAG: hypothetical protein Q9220_006985 [cf. Caloplaca sp. 1 TL-2023]